MKIWEQRSDEKAEDYGYFKIYLDIEPKRSLKKVAEITGEGEDKFKKLSAKFDWQSRVKAYDADKAAEGVTDSATADTADLVTTALVLGHAINPARAEVAENTGDTFSLTTETPVPKTPFNGAFEAPQVPPPQDSTTLLPVADLPAPSRTLDQLADDFNLKIAKGDSRIKEGLVFYIDAGRDLSIAKKFVKHGDWEIWLKSKSQYPIRRAQKYMQLADRFGYLVDKPEIAENLSVTQLFELLSLPEGEEQNFIDKLTAEGKALADMTQKETRAEVKDYNAELAAARADAEKEKSRADKLQGQLDLFSNKIANAKAEIAKKTSENDKLQKQIKELENNPTVVEVDSEETKKALANSQEQISKLKEQIAAAPADTESLKSEIAQLKSTQADAAKRAEAFVKINTAADIIATVDKNFIQDFAREYPDKFKAICSLFATAD